MIDICLQKSLTLIRQNMKSLHIGEMVKEIISDKNLTQSEVADRMNMSRNGLHATLNKENINTELIIRLSKALNVNLWEAIYHRTVEGVDYNSPNMVTKVHEQKINSYSKEKITISFEVPTSKKDEILKIING